MERITAQAGDCMSYVLETMRGVGSLREGMSSGQEDQVAKWRDAVK